MIFSEESMLSSFRKTSPVCALLQSSDPRWLLVAVLLSLVGVAMSRSIPSAGLSLLLILPLLLVLGISWRSIFELCMLLLGFALFVVVLFALTIPGEPLWGFAYASEKGLYLGLVLSFKLFSSSLLILLLASAKPLEDYLRAARFLFLPASIATILLLTIRYLQVLNGRYLSFRYALRTRGYRRTFSSHSYITTGRVLGTLMLSGMDQAERVSAAMRCRGFTGVPRSVRDWPAFRWSTPLLFLAIVSVSWMPFLFVLWYR